MGKDQSTQEKAKELGLNEDRIAKGLKSNNKEVTEAVNKAYAFKHKKRK